MFICSPHSLYLINKCISRGVGYRVCSGHLPLVLAQCTRRSLAVRLALLMVPAWLTVVMFIAALLVAPVSAGRALLFAIPQLPVAGALKSNGNDCSPKLSRSTLSLKFIC